jgi:hypothetical protein
MSRRASPSGSDATQPRNRERGSRAGMGQGCAAAGDFSRSWDVYRLVPDPLPAPNRWHERLLARKTVEYALSREDIPMKYAGAAVGCVALLLALPASAQQFSADLVTDRLAPPGAGGAPAPHTEKLYVSDGKMRVEMGGDKGSVLVIDGKANKATMLMPSQKAFMELPATNRMFAFIAPMNADDPCAEWLASVKKFAKEETGEATCKKIGTETVNGRPANKIQLGSPKGESTAWVDAKLKIVIKLHSDKGNGMELQNIKEEAQPADLFAIPADFKKLGSQQQ